LWIRVRVSVLVDRYEISISQMRVDL
jgi:hypothetical protein